MTGRRTAVGRGCRERREGHEAGRYETALRHYERASVRSHTSLALLNIGQAFIISVGLTIVMLMTGQGIVEILLRGWTPSFSGAYGYFGYSCCLPNARKRIP